MSLKGSHLTRMDHHSADPDSKFAHLVAPNAVAPHHQHFFNFRVDFDVDGVKNSVTEIQRSSVGEWVRESCAERVRHGRDPAEDRLSAQRDLSFAHQRKWKVYNPATMNRLGYHAAFPAGSR